MFGDGAVCTTAHAEIMARAGSGLEGWASFTEEADGVRILVELKGVSPGKHGVHIHAAGDCSAADFTSAEGHFDPDNVGVHGAPDSPKHHAGDLGNIVIRADGTGQLSILARELTVSPGSRSVVRRAIIVHEKEDDFGQPTGNAGGRIGCGEIKAR